MHYTTDSPLPENRRRAWQKPHLPNVTGTAASYRPPGHDYSGGRRAAAAGDYQPWTPDA
jgi:NADH:ubiquinone oxidoreductase subunit